MQVARVDQQPDPPFVNIAILGSDHVSKDTPIDELYSELTTYDGVLLFECAALVKQSGIDLMSCPLGLCLRLRVRRRLSQGAIALWHCLLPLSVISKNLLQPPHEWETWLGLFPLNHSLETHPPETWFTQSIHLISRPEFLKLRLRFTYHNPELKAQMAMRQQCEQEAQQRKAQEAAYHGQQQFQDLLKHSRGRKTTDLDSSASAVKVSQPESVPLHVKQPSPVTVEASANFASTVKVLEHDSSTSQVKQLATITVETFAGPAEDASSIAKLKDALSDALSFVRSASDMLGCPDTDALLTVEGALASSTPGSSPVKAHCDQLRDRLASALAAANRTGNDIDEVDLAEGLRYALMGMLQGADQPHASMTFIGLSAQSTDKLSSIQAQYPDLFAVFCEVSKLSLERLSLMEQISGGSTDEAVQSQIAAAQQESCELRRQLVEARQMLQRREQEVLQLKQLASHGAQAGNQVANSGSSAPQLDLL
eukprot:TRINITY_DN29786_c0_g1_i1.p1 TRINITY_DN29786_c0_g1~~TRINITY_DN29786_c0_g1_i1.p1  ORF type:complete len:482 (+),score=95.45 TRINITY_DN29786_c0_g1_i1:153-1598(+)